MRLYVCIACKRDQPTLARRTLLLPSLSAFQNVSQGFPYLFSARRMFRTVVDWFAANNKCLRFRKFISIIWKRALSSFSGKSFYPSRDLRGQLVQMISIPEVAKSCHNSVGGWSGSPQLTERYTQR